MKKHLGGIDPLGVSMSVLMQRRRIPTRRSSASPGNVSEGSVRDDPQPTIFYSHRQMNETAMTLLVRTNQPAAIANAAVAAIHRLDPNLAVTRIRTFEGALAESLARERLIALISGGFALIGLLLASLGLYGLLAFLVTERTREIGIRMVLGAQTGRVTRSVVGGGLRLVAIGAAIGIAGSLVLLRSLRTLLFGVTPNDAATYASRPDAARRRRGAGVVSARPPRRARRAADRPSPGIAPSPANSATAAIPAILSTHRPALPISDAERGPPDGLHGQKHLTDFARRGWPWWPPLRCLHGGGRLGRRSVRRCATTCVRPGSGQPRPVRLTLQHRTQDVLARLRLRTLHGP